MTPPTPESRTTESRVAAAQIHEIRVYGTLEALRDVQSDWEQLLADFPSATTFSTPDWLIPWWHAFGKGDLKILAFYDATRRLVALAPMCVVPFSGFAKMKLKLLRFMGDGSGDSDNLDFIVLPGYEAAFADALVGYMSGDDIDWDFCQLNTMPNNSLAGAVFVSRIEERGWPHFTRKRPWLVTHFPPTWEGYLETLTSETRNNLKRYTRRLGKHYQVEISRCIDEAQLESCLADLFRLHQKRWELRGEPGTFASEARRNFYLELSRALLAHDYLEFWLIKLNGETGAAQFCFRYKDSVFLLQEGFDPDKSSDRVGFVLRGHVLEQLMAAGVRRYDFLFGQSEGKHMWAPQTQQYRDIHFARPSTRGNLHLNLTRKAKESKEWLRAHLPQSAWETLKSLNPKSRRDSKKSQVSGLGSQEKPKSEKID
jgi:CelD/BcsL family acetyltransferase involved in cellulose biosynthesis